MPDRIVHGQHVDGVKLQRAKELRKHMTPAEAMLWSTLRTNQLKQYHYRRQQVIAGFIVDFYCHAASLVVEVDGGIHDEQQEYGTERDQALTARGLRILRVSNDEVRNDLPAVLSRISEACGHHAAPATATEPITS